MSKVDVLKLRMDILDGMRASAEKLKASKKKSGSPIVISENGVIKKIEATNETS